MRRSPQCPCVEGPWDTARRPRQAKGKPRTINRHKSKVNGNKHRRIPEKPPEMSLKGGNSTRQAAGAATRVDGKTANALCQPPESRIARIESTSGHHYGHFGLCQHKPCLRPLLLLAFTKPKTLIISNRLLSYLGAGQ
jgi:hypothetical protein